MCPEGCGYPQERDADPTEAGAAGPRRGRGVIAGAPHSAQRWPVFAAWHVAARGISVLHFLAFPCPCFRRARSPHLCWHGACVVCVFALVCSTFFHATALVLCLFFTTLHIRRDARSGSVGSLRSQRAGDQSAVHCAMSSPRPVCLSFDCCRVSVLRSQRACSLFVRVRSYWCLRVKLRLFLYL